MYSIDNTLENIVQKAKQDPTYEFSLYGELAPVYDYLYGASYDYENQASFIREYAPDNVSRVLDIGCGTGRLEKELATVFPDAEIHGIDINKDMATIAEDRTVDEEQVVIRNEGFEDVTGEYDVIVSFGVSSHFDEQQTSEFLATASDLLSDKGVFIYDYKDPEEDVTGRVNRYEGATEEYDIVSWFLTLYKDGQSYYANSYEFTNTQTGEVTYAGTLFEIYFYRPDQLREFTRVHFDSVTVQTGVLDQSGVVIASSPN